MTSKPEAGVRFALDWTGSYLMQSKFSALKIKTFSINFPRIPCTIFIILLNAKLPSSSINFVNFALLRRDLIAVM